MIRIIEVSFFLLVMTEDSSQDDLTVHYNRELPESQFRGLKEKFQVQHGPGACPFQECLCKNGSMFPGISENLPPRPEKIVIQLR